MQRSRALRGAAARLGVVAVVVGMLCGSPSAVLAQPGPLGPPTIVEVTAGDVRGLIEAVEAAAENPTTEIRIRRNEDGQLPPFTFRTRPDAPPNVLPPIRSVVRIVRPPGDPGFLVFENALDAVGTRRFAEIAPGGVLRLGRVRLQGFGIDGDGGVFRLIGNGMVRLSDCLITGNAATARGGVFFAEAASAIFVERCIFDANASGVGGAIVATVEGGFFSISDALFARNEAPNGCVAFQQADAATELEFNGVIRNSTFAGGCGLLGGELIVNEAGRLVLHGNTIVGARTALRANAPVRLFGNLISAALTAKGDATGLCDGDDIESLGFNLAGDASCSLDQESDQPDTDAEAEFDGDTIVLKEGSGAIDGASAELLAAVAANLDTGLPCGYKDVRDLGRPQDADGNGVFQCDIGDFEVQGGENIDAAQSGAFIDPDRPGEGVFLEILPGGLAFAGFFTYRPDAAAPAWFVGVGTVVGNSVVFDEIQELTGGTFGPAFDPAEVIRERIGAMSMVFSTCEAGAGQGKLAFQAIDDGPYPDLLVDANRLSTVVPCVDDLPANAGRSGSFFDPDRDGEGIFVQWLPDGRAVVIWYTYDPDGNPFWTISGDVVIDGSSITANMLYPAQATKFGAEFDPAELVLGDWGTLTLEYIGCDAITLGYESVLEGFGSGGYEYVRLTALDGTDCSF